MSSPQDQNLTPPWKQPLGSWRARGATTNALRLGMGLPALTNEKASAPEVDHEGYNLWHYWAESPRPLDLWSSTKARLLHDMRNAKAKNGEHPWHRLALRGQLAAMQAWAKDFGNPLLEDPSIIGLGAAKDTIATCAAWSGNDETLTWLLGLGADINDADEQGFTPLMIAIHRCSAQAVVKLLEAGADPEAKDLKGRSALHHAAQSEHTDLYTLIEDCGGDPGEKDSHGMTAKSLLERAIRTPQQAFVAQSHWEMRYYARLIF